MARTSGIEFSILPVVWKDCAGYAQSFASDHLANYVAFPSVGFTTKTPEPFVSMQLSQSLFHEIQHYVDRALYHLIVGKWMISKGVPTWGMVSYYYSAFFSAQAAIRLRGTFFAKIRYDSEVNSPPTHRIDVLNLGRGEYQIRQASAKGEHIRVWAAFYDLFGKVSGRGGYAKFGPITDIDGLEERLAEMHRRHLLNYVPGHGYLEVRSPKDAEKWCSELNGNLLSDLARHVNHEDCQLEVRAILRLELCAQILHRISDVGGAYGIHHPRLCERRLKWIDEFECPEALAIHLRPLFVLPK